VSKKSKATFKRTEKKKIFKRGDKKKKSYSGKVQISKASDGRSPAEENKKRKVRNWAAGVVGRGGAILVVRVW